MIEQPNSFIFNNMEKIEIPHELLLLHIVTRMRLPVYTKVATGPIYYYH